VPAQAPAAAAPVDKDREPSLAWLVVQNNRVAAGLVEGAATAGLGEAGEGGAAVRGDRCAGDVVGGGPASGGVVGDDDVVGVSWVSRPVCLRLGSVYAGVGLRCDPIYDVSA